MFQCIILSELPRTQRQKMLKKRKADLFCIKTKVCSVQRRRVVLLSRRWQLADSFTRRSLREESECTSEPMRNINTTHITNVCNSYLSNAQNNMIACTYLCENYYSCMSGAKAEAAWCHCLAKHHMEEVLISKHTLKEEIQLFYQPKFRCVCEESYMKAFVASAGADQMNWLKWVSSNMLGLKTTTTTSKPQAAR